MILFVMSLCLYVSAYTGIQLFIFGFLLARIFNQSFVLMVGGFSNCIIFYTTFYCDDIIPYVRCTCYGL